MCLNSGLRGLLCILGLGFLALDCAAGSLQVSTTTLDISAPSAASSLQLRNTGTQTTDVQIRLFKWTQAAQTDLLEEARDVIASPPFASIEPGQQFTVRIVRTAREPVGAEESYRLLIDELPPPRAADRLGVKFAVRYSIPVFFGPPARPEARLVWRAAPSTTHLRLTVTNGSNRRVRLASLKLHSAGGSTIAERKGLVGYVLGGSSMTWNIPVVKDRPGHGPWTLTADADGGPIHAEIGFASAP